MAYIVMVTTTAHSAVCLCTHDLYSYGLYSYVLDSYGLYSHGHDDRTLGGMSSLTKLPLPVLRGPCSMPHGPMPRPSRSHVPSQKVHVPCPVIRPTSHVPSYKVHSAVAAGDLQELEKLAASGPQTCARPCACRHAYAIDTSVDTPHGYARRHVATEPVWGDPFSEELKIDR